LCPCRWGFNFFLLDLFREGYAICVTHCWVLGGGTVVLL
jgi:hypothetical protein